MKGDKNVDIQALKDIANKLRIDSIVATNASKSGWVDNQVFMLYWRSNEGYTAGNLLIGILQIV